MRHKKIQCQLQKKCCLSNFTKMFCKLDISKIIAIITIKDSKKDNKLTDKQSEKPTI